MSRLRPLSLGRRFPRPSIFGTEAMTSLKRAVFACHSNPLSAWSRWASIPLIAAPFWTRSRRVTLLVGGWMLANPVIFPEPRTKRAWATRAMLGEEEWSSRPRRDLATAVNVATTVAMAGLVVGGWRRSWTVVVPAAGVQMGLVMWFWKLMADRYDHAAPAGADEAE